MSTHWRYALAGQPSASGKVLRKPSADAKIVQIARPISIRPALDPYRIRDRSRTASHR